ncbi:MAG TPA: hypothetical protein VH083_11755, partial [Myxococcales bacterium]|nr:hypothetical protein [Myxococcales bacterium]
MIALLAASLLLAAGDPPEPPIELAPLSQPAPKPAKKKKKKVAPAPEPELALPPLPAPPQAVQSPEVRSPAGALGGSQLPPSPLLTKPSNETGLIVLMDTPDLALEQSLADAVRNIIAISPGNQHPQLLPTPAKACDAACMIELATWKKLDRIVTIFHRDDSVGISVFDTAAGREVSQESRATSGELQFNLVTAELLACEYLVPAGCTGEVPIFLGKGVQLEMDGKPLPPGTKVLPVGVHYLVAISGMAGSRRQRVFIVRERNAPVYAILGSNGPYLSDTPPPAPARPAAVAATVPQAALGTGPAAPVEKSRVLRPVGYGLLGAAVIAGGIGTYLGVKSKSDLNSAESGFKANGGAYSKSDLNNLNSGNSAAHGANGLFIAAGVLAVA